MAPGGRWNLGYFYMQTCRRSLQVLTGSRWTWLAATACPASSWAAHLSACSSELDILLVLTSALVLGPRLCPQASAPLVPPRPHLAPSLSGLQLLVTSVLAISSQAGSFPEHGAPAHVTIERSTCSACPGRHVLSSKETVDTEN